ncbi:MAG: molybdopterin-dependent oxidoreductase, partial [Thermoplasmata archaeon]|nr:molybdopterin-dependent oxidoreductase [Thermoplasmata archaeon]
VALGGGRDGKISALRMHNVNGGSSSLRAPYRIPNRKLDNELSDSPLPQGPYRSIAAAMNNFARESAIDEFCRRAKIDPLDFRLKNIEDERLLDATRKVAEISGWTRRMAKPGTGFGLAVGLEKGARVATVAEVRVDDERRVKVEVVSTVVDAGAIVHPKNLRAQVEGAMMMGLGGALFERVRFDAGAVTNPRLSAYRVPRFSDLPRLVVELIDRRDIPPAGAGETPLIAVAPALGNALFDASGMRLRELPLVPSGRLGTERSG